MNYAIIFSLLSSLLLSSIAVSATTVYKKINEDGSVEYSDKPFPGAKPLKLKNISDQTTLPVPTPPSKLSPATPNKAAKVTYDIAITSPAQGATIRNNQGNFTVLVQKKGEARKRYKSRVFVNGVPVGSASQDAVFNIKNADRGELKIKAQLLSSSGKVLATSNETVVYLHRATSIRAR